MIKSNLRNTFDGMDVWMDVCNEMYCDETINVRNILRDNRNPFAKRRRKIPPSWSVDSRHLEFWKANI
jgi:hypothetical protein